MIERLFALHRSLSPMGLVLVVASAAGLRCSSDIPGTGPAGGAGGQSAGGASGVDASVTGGAGGRGGGGASGTGGSGGGAGKAGAAADGGKGTGGAAGSGGAGTGGGGASGTGGSGTSGAAGKDGSAGSAGNAGSAGSDASRPDVIAPPQTDGGARGLGGKLGKTNFMIGLGPNESPYTATGQLDIRYAYLVGNADPASSWPRWNSPDGEFAAIVARGADQRGAIPMFDVYEFAADGDGNFAIVRDATFMRRFWADLQLLADKIKAFDKPAIVHLEPDFWGYAQTEADNNDPKTFSAQVKIAPTCADLPDDLTGLGRCAMRIFRTTSPKAVVGLHASQWAAYDNSGNPDGAAVGRFLALVTGGEADFVATDILDRDAGCFEAKPSQFDCDRGGTTGWYWDETNTTSPNFREYLTWSKAMGQAAGVPILWWQTPLGVPNTAPGGSPNRYRDNRVRYIFSHVREFIDAGGVGVCFGAGADGQTTVATDDNQFQNALTTYNQSPVPL